MDHTPSVFIAKLLFYIFTDTAILKKQKQKKTLYFCCPCQTELGFEIQYDDISTTFTLIGRMRSFDGGNVGKINKYRFFSHEHSSLMEFVE